MKDRIDNARKVDVKAGQQGARVQPALNVPPDDRKIEENKKQGQIVSRPLQERITNGQSAVTQRTLQPVSKAAVVTPPDRTRQPNSPNNSVKVSTVAPVRPATAQVRPPVVTAKPVQNPQRPAQPVARAPEPVRQAPPRDQVKPVEVRRENPVQARVEPARQSPSKEKVSTTVSSPAPSVPPARVAPRNNDDNRGNSRPPEVNRDNKPQFQQNAARR